MSEHPHDEPHSRTDTHADGTPHDHPHGDHEHDHIGDHEHTHADGTTHGHDHDAPAKRPGFLARLFGVR